MLILGQGLVEALGFFFYMLLANPFTWIMLEELDVTGHMGGCQKYGSFLSTLNIRGRNIIEIQKETIILTP